MSKNVATTSQSVMPAVGAFVEGLTKAAASASKGAMFDSAAGQEYVTGLKSRPQGDVSGLPDSITAVLEQFDKPTVGEDGKVKKAGGITQALLDSAAHYKKMHGSDMPADLATQALLNAYSLTDHAKSKYGAALQLDSASNHSHDPMSLQPDRAVVAVIATVNDACPVAMYLPADIGSNEARLAIMTHTAGSNLGGYSEKEGMDGINAGRRFISSRRTHTAFPAADGTVTGKITLIQATSETCKQDGPLAKTLRGRAEIYVNGLLVGRESNQDATGANPVNGKINIGGVEYIIGGQYNPENGEFALTTNPKLDSSVPVSVIAALDIETMGEGAIAQTAVHVATFTMYAERFSAFTRISPDAQSQISNELGLDPLSESVLAFQRQFAAERHYDAIDMITRAGVNNMDTYDFEWDKRSTDMTRAKIWGDFGAKLGERSQVMAEATMSHGFSHAYAGKMIVAQWRSLPRDIFEPSGLSDRPGIYRVGRLFGQIDVYYNPRAKEDEQAGTAQIVFAGKGNQVARNPIIFGDSVAPSVRPLTPGNDLKNGAGFYGRGISSINPHQPSAQGTAIINVIGLKR